MLGQHLESDGRESIPGCWKPKNTVLGRSLAVTPYAAYFSALLAQLVRATSF